MDIVDSLFAPSTSNSEEGGLSAREIIYIASRIAMMKNLRAFDIVEVDSTGDKDRKTTRLASKILAELI